MQNYFRLFSRWLLLILLLIGFCLFFYFHLYEYLSFATLKSYHDSLSSWANQHYLLAVLVYMSIYTLIAAMSLPGAIFITLAGGFLFGPIATIYVVISATLGASILFLAVRSALGEWLASKASGWVAKMEKGFHENAFNYLLVLRLIPIFPFWVVNIVAALFALELRTFVLATFIGIIPGSFIYVLVGNSLNVVFHSNQTPNLHIIFTPPILLPLLGLAILALLPVIYKRYTVTHPTSKGRKDENVRS